MAQFLQDLPDEYGLLAIVEDSADFGLCGRSHDILHDAGLNVDGSVWFGEWGWLGLVTQVEDAAGAGSGVWFTQVRCIAVNIENHVTPVKSNSSIRV